MLLKMLLSTYLKSPLISDSQMTKLKLEIAKIKNKIFKALTIKQVNRLIIDKVQDEIKEADRLYNSNARSRKKDTAKIKKKELLS